MARLTLILILTWAAPSQAGLLDDIMAWFSGDEAPAEVTKETAKEAAPATSGALATAAKVAASTSLALLPSVVQTFGVTEAQATGGLGAIFMAAEATLAPEDFKLVSDAVPNIDRLISAAPPTNELVGNAMSLLGGSDKTTAAANLVTQFNALGLEPGMIAEFGQEAIDYVKAQSPEASKKLSSVLGDYL